MLPYRPEKILVEQGAETSSVTRRILARLPDVPVETVPSAEALLESKKRERPTLTEAKRSLLLARFKGDFFKECPGQQSRAVVPNVCCDYFVINLTSNCHMECTYCFLQSYLTFPYLVVYVNIDDLFRELSRRFAAEPDRVFRVGTGELADSLALDHLTGYGQSLVGFFATQRNAILELKTKTGMVDDLIGLRHNRRTILAWSVNPPDVVRLEELKTSSLSRRLSAASRCCAAGYPIGFHFDPLVHYQDWARDYRELVDRIFAAVPPDQVAWISLGGLRMPSAQREGIKERFPHSSLPYGELVPAEDGKLRYFKAIRLEMYHSLLGWIREHSPQARVYTCMERPEVWRRVFEGTPPSNRELNDYLTGEWAPTGSDQAGL